ncbi:MAG: dihydroorotate dehydrogenase electron transfer subunit, partial [Nitrospinota bacterium]
VIDLPQFEALGFSPQISTDDGSLGTKGFVTELLKEHILSIDNPNDYLIYSCGPNVMLREVHRIASAASIECQVSLEGRMGCGLGACLSCVVPDKDNKYVTVCKDGPVFDSRSLSW